MGFGILFISHILLFFFKGVDVFPDVIAYALMAYALKKLSPYAPGFNMAFKAMYAVIPLSLISDGLQIASAIGAKLPSPVVMAAGTFISGASIELSADAPLREPYAIYFQGGLTYPSAKLGILMTIENLRREGLLPGGVL